MPGEEAQIGPLNLPDYLRPVYANFVNVGCTPWDFRFVFGVLKAPTPGAELDEVSAAGAVRPEAVADIILPANLIFGFMSALQNVWNKYNEQYGVPGMNPEGPVQPE